MIHMVVSIHTAQKLGNSIMLGDWILILSFRWGLNHTAVSVIQGRSNSWLKE